MATARKNTESKSDGDYPAFWDWDEDGDEVEGLFVAIGRGFTQMGERAFVTLDVGGTERTLWLHWEALRNQFVREVERRPDRMIHRGERVKVRRLGSRESVNGYTYFDFRSEFFDGPETSQADILGIQTSASETGENQAEQSGTADGDDVPF